MPDDVVATPQDEAQPQSDGDESQTQPEPAEADTASSTQTEESTAPEPPKWIYQLPGDLQADERLRGFSNLGELAKTFLSEREAADQKVIVPGDDSDDETREQFYKALGRPDQPDGYELSKPEDADQLAATDEALSEFASKAHELGLSKQQAQALHDWNLERTRQAVSEMTEKQQAEKQKRIEQLKKDFGDEFNTKVENAKTAFRELGGDELLGYLKNTGQEDEPDLIRAFSAIYEKIADDSMETGTVDPFGNKKGKAEWYPNSNF